jgi:hypothetical protein
MSMNGHANGSNDAGNAGSNDAGNPATNPVDGGHRVMGCGLTNINPTCDLCLQSSCCAQAAACAGDPDCSTLVDCLALAPFTDGGVAQCDSAAGATAQEEYGTFQACMNTTCSTSCASCHGVPELCEGHADQSSCDTAGCVWSGQCTGSAYFCLGMGQYACASQQGCYYEYTSMDCTGVAESCSDFSGQFTCIGQGGCHWQTGCTGVSALSCSSLLDQTSCLSAGCTWD